MTYSHDSLLEMLRDWTDTARKADTILKGVPMPQPNAAALEALPRPAAIRSDRGAAMTYTPQAWRLTGYYPESYARLMDILNGGILPDWDDDDHNRHEAEFRADLAAHDAEVRAQALAPIRAALADHPRCDIHPDDDPIKCGWKRAVADIQAALDREEQP